MHLKEISLDEQKAIQLEILASIHEYCTKHHIKYSMACGTLLGAARHKGYIPWDDDIDIYLLRKDYNTLMSLFPENYKGIYKIASLCREKTWDRAYAKAYDNRTVFIEPGNKFPLGVNIDIFPIDDVPDDNNEWLKYDKLRRKIQHIYNFKFIQFPAKRTIFKNIIIGTLLVILSVFSKRFIANRIDSYIQRNNGNGFSKCFESCQGIFIKAPIDKKLFDTIVLYPFENRFFYAFKDYDAYLTAAYGDWRKLPPVEKRVSHHINKSYWR